MRATLHGTSFKYKTASSKAIEDLKWANIRDVLGLAAGNPSAIWI